MPISQLIARLSAVLVVAALPAGSVSAQPAARPLAALISELSGSASIRSAPGAAVSNAQRFDAVIEGGTIELGRQSRAVVVLAGGRRFELGPGARVTVAAKQLVSSSGPVTEQAPLPPLPKVAALGASRPAGPAGAVRLRAATISGLYPAHAVTLAERTVLRFTPVTGASKYSVDIENEAGQRVFLSETTTPEVAVPAGMLKPGTAYYWSVQALDVAGATPRGLSEFKTLSAEDARARDALHQSLQREAGAGSLALQAELDRRLGLYQEALDGFRAQLARTPDDTAVREAVRQLEQRLQGPSIR